MRIAPRAAVALLILAAPAAASAPVAATKVFGGWTATCDNLRDCVVIGSSEEGDALFYVRIARSAALSAAPDVKVVVAAPDPIPDLPGAIALTVKGAGKPDSFVAGVRKADADGAAIAANVPDVAILPSLAGAQTLDYAAGALKGMLALAQLPAALRFVDDQQQRTGTPTALVARGMTPLGQLPPPSPLPQVQAASVVATPVASPNLGRALLEMAKPACDPEVVEAHSDAAAWTLGPDHQLVAVPCEEGATNVSSALFVTNAKGEGPRPAMLEQPPQQGDAAVDNVVVNYEFDPQTLTLSSIDKGRGLGDCGSMRTWVWTGEIFALLRASRLEACPGALPDDWPTVYVAKRK